MTLPRTAAEVLSGHVMLEVRYLDRVLLTLRQPRLQYGQGIHNFFCQHQRLRGDACRNRMKRPRGDARS